MKNLLLLSFLILAGMAHAQNVVLLYQFDNNTNDDSGNGYNGTLTGNASFITNAPGACIDGCLKLGKDSTSSVIIPPEALNGLKDFKIESNFLITGNNDGAGNQNTLLSGSRDGCINCFGIAFSHDLLSWVIDLNGNKHLFPGYGSRPMKFERYNGTIYVFGDDVLLGSVFDSSAINLTSLHLGNKENCVGGCFEKYQSLFAKVDYLQVWDGLCLDTLEPNNQAGQASSIITNQTYSAMLPSFDDVDWFKFIVGTENNVRITLFNLSKNNDIVLYNSDLEVIGQAHNPSTTSDTIIANGLPAGVYIILAYPKLKPDKNDCYSILTETSNTPWRISDHLSSYEEGIEISPNPASSFFSLNYNLSQVSCVRIIDAFGRIVKEINLDASSNNITISTNDLAAGVYLVTVNDGDKRISKKLIISK